jgi:hypothetical protein
MIACGSQNLSSLFVSLFFLIFDLCWPWLGKHFNHLFSVQPCPSTCPEWFPFVCCFFWTQNIRESQSCSRSCLLQNPQNSFSLPLCFCTVVLHRSTGSCPVPVVACTFLDWALSGQLWTVYRRYFAHFRLCCESNKTHVTFWWRCRVEFDSHSGLTFYSPWCRSTRRLPFGRSVDPVPATSRRRGFWQTCAEVVLIILFGHCVFCGRLEFVKLDLLFSHG